jgi:hypothetical protein
VPRTAWDLVGNGVALVADDGRQLGNIWAGRGAFTIKAPMGVAYRGGYTADSANPHEELFGFLGAHFGRLPDVRIHNLDEPCGVDGIQVNRIEFGKHTRSTVLTTSVGNQSMRSVLYEPLAATACLPGAHHRQRKSRGRPRLPSSLQGSRSLDRRGLWAVSLNRSGYGPRSEQRNQA